MSSTMDTEPLILFDVFEHIELLVEDIRDWWVKLREELVRQGFVLVTCQQLEKDPCLRPRVHGAIAVNMSLPPVNKILPSLENLRTISFPSAGISDLDVQHCKQAGISVGNISPALGDFVADHAMTLLLSAARRLIPGIKIAESGKKGCRLPQYGFHVTGSTIGIVGMGFIGYKIAERAHNGFGIKVLYCNRKRRTLTDEALIGAEYYASLHDMLPRCDAVILSCPLTAETRGMIGQREFSVMKNNALLVNVARGKVVKQDELVTALQSGQIGQAALDVTDPEPLPKDHPLLHMDNVIVTAHMSSETPSTCQRVVEMTIENLKRGLRGEPLVSGINVQNKQN